MRHDPNTWWWVKADGCDILAGLAESIKGVWSGDVDLAAGDLQRQYDEYQSQLKVIAKLSLTSREGVLHELAHHSSTLQEDQQFTCP